MKSAKVFRACSHLLLLLLLCFGISAAQADLSTGLVGWWKFDEATSGACAGSSVLDSTGQGRVGTCNNSPGWVAGKIGAGAMNFNGSSQYVYVSSYSNTSGKFTVSVWCKANVLNTWGTFVKNWGNGVQGQFHLGLDVATGMVGVQITQSNGATPAFVQDTSVLPLYSWQHYVAVADGSRVHLYRNTVEVGTPVSYDGTLTSALSCVGIGAKVDQSCNGAADAGSPGFWNGTLDDVRIYNRALTADEVKALYTGSVLRNASFKNAHLGQ